MLDKILEECATEWMKAKSLKKHPFRYCSLATVGSNSSPESRMVVLRHFEPSTFLFTIYSDQRSSKITALENNPLGELLFYDSKKMVQVRVKARCVLITEDSEVYAQQHEKAQKDYTTSRPPGTKIKSMDEIRYTSKNHFVKLIFKAEKIEYLRLKRPNHHRAIFEILDGKWESHFLVP